MRALTIRGGIPKLMVLLGRGARVYLVRIHHGSVLGAISSPRSFLFLLPGCLEVTRFLPHLIAELCIDWSQAATQSHPPLCPHTLQPHRIVCYSSEQPSLATPQCWRLSSASLTESCLFPEWHFLTLSSRCDSNVSFPGNIFLLSQSLQIGMGGSIP